MTNKIDIKRDYNPLALVVKFNKIRTIEHAINSNQKSLAVYKKEYSKDYVINYIVLWIVSINEFLSISRKMTTNQIKETAVYIYDDYHYLNLADIYLIFTKIKKGEFGQLYESIDGSKIISFFNKYANERANIYENNSNKIADKIKYLNENYLTTGAEKIGKKI